MQDSPMEFFNKLSGNLLGRINSCMLGRIEKFNAIKMKADIVLLVRDKPMLIEVPVSFMKAGPFVIRPPYKKEDIVLVVFADEDIDNILLSGEISDPNSTRKHSLDDAIVVGGIMPFIKGLPSEHTDDLVIGKDDFTSKIVLKENGEILIASSVGITISGPTKSESW